MGLAGMLQQSQWVIRAHRVSEIPFWHFPLAREQVATNEGSRRSLSNPVVEVCGANGESIPAGKNGCGVQSDPIVKVG